MNDLDVEVCIPTRGDVGAALAGLVTHACRRPFAVRIITERIPPPQALDIADMLRRLGCRVTIELQERKGNGGARAQAAFNTDAKVIVSLDDDAVLAPEGAVHALAAAVLAKPTTIWVTPIIRFAQNFTDPPEGHTEIWEGVDEEDPRVQRALEARGAGWIRVFDTGEEHVTGDLGGTCYAVRPIDLIAHTGKLREWNPAMGGVDAWLGKLLGPGIVLPRIYAYHFGKWSPGKWGADAVLNRLWRTNPEAIADVAMGGR